MVHPNLQFFIGKGGVGKSTTSALTAIKHAGAGIKTLLVSMDPAHNQRDIFQQAFSEKPRQVMPNLAIKEVDIDYWVNFHLKATEAHLKKAYSYQSAFNIQSYYGILRHSPGLEEYAMLLAFENTVHADGTQASIIFDMPPTALTLRFFSLPFITLIWLRELLKIRQQIYAKKEIVSKIKFGQATIEQDKVLARLKELIEKHDHLRKHFTDAGTGVNIVLNNDPLSLAEALRIRDKLADIGIDITRVVVNKISDADRMGDITHRFNGHPLSRFPLSTRELYGLEALNAYISEYDVP